MKYNLDEYKMLNIKLEQRHLTPATMMKGAWAGKISKIKF